MNTGESGLRRQLGLAAVAAIVIGNMLGSGIFFIPAELAGVAGSSWQIYLLWSLSGFIVLCGALTLAELSSLLPRSGASYHIIREAYGPFWGFLKIWMQMWVGGPGSVAGVAMLFGEFLVRLLPNATQFPVVWAVLAIVFFTVINICGVRWGGLTQILITGTKIAALLILIAGSIFLFYPTGSKVASTVQAAGFLSFVNLVGVGIAAVLFTYDGWIDVTHVSGEVTNPCRNLPWGLAGGVLAVIVLYLLANYAYLRVLSLDEMRKSSDLIASRVAGEIFGSAGSLFITIFITISIFGALGGLVMTLPRLFFAGAFQYDQQLQAEHPLHRFFHTLSWIYPRTSVPVSAVLFSATISIMALLFFQSFSRLVTFLLVPLQAANMLMVASIFRLRKRYPVTDAYRTPGYPVTPLLFIGVIALFLVSNIVYKPGDSLIGIILTATGAPVYLWMKRSLTRFQEGQL